MSRLIGWSRLIDLERLWRSCPSRLPAGCVLVPEGAGEHEVATGGGSVLPAEAMPDDVVMAAHRAEVAGAGDPGFDPRYPVIDIAVDRRHAAAGVNTGGLQSFGFASLRG
jgi:hypothetical protein